MNDERIRIKMLATTPGCDIGVVYPLVYKKDEIYPVGRILAEQFLNLAVAEVVDDKFTVENPVDRHEPEAEKTKAHESAPENKKKKAK